MPLVVALPVVVTFLAFHIIPAEAATAFGCTGTLTDAQREEFLNLMNDLRKEVAAGSTIMDASNTTLTAENMYKLDWSCDFEQMAQNLVQSCSAYPSYPPAENALIFKQTLPPAAPQTEPLKAALTEWKDSITTATWLADNGYLAVIKQFQEMVRAGALMVGCSESVCAGGVVASAGCIFNLPPLKNGDVVFKSGKGCTAGGPCDTYPSSKCDSTAGLCVTSSASTTASTAASTATTVASGSSTASGATSAPSAGNVICPGNTNMNDRIREKALTMHNYRRSQLASGNIAKNNGRYLPTAADMVQLKYDCDLEKAAKAHADTCSFAYSSAASSASTSENIATIPKTSTVVNRVDATSEAIKSWWKNVRTQTVNIGMLVTFKQKHVGYPIESFIKMAWAKSTKFGCGAKLCSNNNFFVVCQYTPKGAIVNQVVYQTGSPCAACPAASSCVSPLCVYA
ncbi:hypothetical protein Q1695_008238 [Nippostrongylus brasiliensis]|nr:hypothetical protein Q1695_008238 [Nippostrongylus brasiliensis]